MTGNTIINNRYELIEYIGGGAFGEVWKAKDTFTDQFIAIKIYVRLDKTGEEMFKREYARLMNISHPNIVSPLHFDFWITDTSRRAFLVMRYIDNGSIHKLIKKVNQQLIWRFIFQIASALEYLHSKKITHNDLRPDNILFDSLYNFYITDFGISTDFKSTLRKSVNISNEEAGVLPMPYRALEYFSPNLVERRHSPQKDIFAFGVTIFELITGEYPYGEYGGLVLQSNPNFPLPSIPKNFGNILNDLIKRMISKNPKDRPTALAIKDIAKYQLEKIGNNIALDVNFTQNENDDKFLKTSFYDKKDFSKTSLKEELKQTEQDEKIEPLSFKKSKESSPKGFGWYLKVIKDYGVFKGRASRREFWTFTLFDIIFQLLFGGLGYLLLNDYEYEGLGKILMIFYIIYLFFTIIPRLAVTVRRLHDTGRSGWTYFISIIPYIGYFILLYFLAQKGDIGPNKYGPDPLE